MRFHFVALFLVVCNGCVSAAFAEHTNNSCDSLPTAVHQLPEALAELAERYDVPAFGLAIVVDDDPCLVRAVGRSGNARFPSADLTTPFRIGSISKSLNALLLLQLQASGKLSLRDPVGQWLQPVPWQRWRGLNNTSMITTIADLLEHTAGLGSFHRSAWDNNDPKPLSLPEGVALDQAQRVQLWRPGFFHQYSNPGAGLAGRVAEIATGRSWDDLMQDHVFALLGMRGASTLQKDPRARALVRGYASDAKTLLPYWHMTMRPFGAVNATVPDMARWLAVLASGGRWQGVRVLAEEVVQRMESPTRAVTVRHGLSFGYGLGIYGSVRSGHLFYGHGGDADGYLSRIGYVKLPAVQHNRGYFVIVNVDRPAALAAFRRRIERTLVADLPLPDKPPVKPLSEELLAALARHESMYFVPATRRFQAAAEQHVPGRVSARLVPASTKGHYRWEEFRPVERGERKTIDLLGLGDGLLRRHEDPLATLVLFREDKTIYLSGVLGNWVMKR